ncbi:hypothetical protein BIFADO_00331 [Bifidobacterium adolescentis L2-32]|uniref:Uncharacterized protein n=1 Tax=Bifidobacterium adolescentis L2-32 TaxID=411481 RepID=A7A3E1_BIFAD|nr:hypothetical protein BIFADO_00331 [Bifidobacterium adolescentis L2-32]
MSGIGIGDGMVFVGCGRRTWVIHTLGVSSTLIHKRLGHDGTDRASSVIPTAVRFEQI